MGEHPSTCQQVLVPVLFERGSASFSSPLFSGSDPRKKMPPQRVQREHRRYNPCDCNHHKDLYKDWPSENATWRLASCMRRCPDKNCLSEEFKSASHLRRHAKTPFHKDLGIKVEKETPKYSSEPFFHRHSLTEDQDQDLKATHDSQESILQNGVRRLLEGLDVFDESTKAHLESILWTTSLKGIRIFGNKYTQRTHACSSRKSFGEVS